MFVPVACLKCGKLFQVAAAAAGTDVACPWCRATTPALPVVADHTGGLEPATRPDELLPLEDDDDPPEPRRPGRFPVKTVVAALLLVVGVAAATLAVLRYRSGHVSPTAWAEFAAPDGSCRVTLPGVPAAAHVEPDPADAVARGGERYTATGWYSGVTAWVGWRDLDPGWATQAAADRDGVLTAPVVAAERDRRAREVGGTVAREAAVRLGPHTGSQVVMETPRGQLAEWYVVVPGGPHPRLYFVGLEGKGAAPGGTPGRAAARVFDSFRVTGG